MAGPNTQLLGAGGMECPVPNCATFHGIRIRRGMCQKHYTRWLRNGDPAVTKRAVSTPGMDAPARKRWVQQYKVERGCADCGYNTHPAALDFDHLPGTEKVRDIKNGQQLGWAALQAEVAKCEVVCANCHRIRTSERLVPVQIAVA